MSICNGDIPTFYSIFFGLEIWQHIQKGDSEKSLSTSLPVPLEGLGGFHFVPLNLRKGILSTYQEVLYYPWNVANAKGVDE